MKTHGIKHRVVRTKIGDLEKSFKKAVDWHANTGQGILDSCTKTEGEKEAEIKSHLKKLCPFYEELQLVMGERASSHPFATNEASDDNDNEVGEDDEMASKGDAANSLVSSPTVPPSVLDSVASLESTSSKVN
ncbi:UNVERIFIED_CONTAM: hypothetical protein HDU68_005845, partial [Siphonaria sp. JEL0065]